MNESVAAQPWPQLQADITIVIGPQGQVLVDELPLELVSVLLELSPRDQELVQRQALAAGFVKGQT